MRILTATAIVAAALLAASCLKNDTILYREITMAQVTGPTQFVTDIGLTYNVVENPFAIEFASLSRVIIHCNVLKQTGDREFNVQLLQLADPLNKDAVLTSTLTKPNDGLGNDPIGLSSVWISGGYLNMCVGVLVIDEEKTHTVNLEFDDTAPADTLRFTLRHDDGLADGEEVVFDEKLIGYKYATFPIKKLLPEGVTTLPVKLTWTWDKEYCVKDGLDI